MTYWYAFGFASENPYLVDGEVYYSPEWAVFFIEALSEADAYARLPDESRHFERMDGPPEVVCGPEDGEHHVTIRMDPIERLAYSSLGSSSSPAMGSPGREAAASMPPGDGPNQKTNSSNV